jgi:potassium/hydrogen antiporter
MFFILFGFLIKTDEIINPDTILWAVGIAFIIYLIRAITLFIGKVPVFPLLFVAPRGLITILLFFLILPESRIPLVNKSLITQVILITAFTMLLGLMFAKKENDRLATH